MWYAIRGRLLLYKIDKEYIYTGKCSDMNVEERGSEDAVRSFSDTVIQ